MHAAPDREQVGAPFGGEAGDAVRPEDTGRQLVADADVVPVALAVAEIVQHPDPGELFVLQLGQLLVGPLGILGGVQRAHFAREIGAIADAGGALRGDQVALGVVVAVVAALEAGRSGELGFLDHVVERHAFVVDQVAAVDARAVEPPLVAAEDQVRIGNEADTGRCGAVTVIGGDGKRLRRDDATEAALRGELVLVVHPVRVVHRLDPASDVVVCQRLLQATRLDRLAHVAIEIGTVAASCRSCVTPVQR